jgi:tyrosyl-tRNA synthetase
MKKIREFKHYVDYVLLNESINTSGFKIFPEGSSIPKGIVKFGIDPTLDKIHLGHLVPMLMVKKLKEQGNPISIVLGTYTAMLGDPSGKSETRPMLSASQTKSNASALIEQIERIIGTGITFHYNHEWFEKMSMTDLMQVLSKFTVDYLMSRDAFQKRAESGASIGVHELIVPILQGLDSVELKAAVEVGGTDQLFNFSLSRDVQVKHGQTAEVCLMAPIINGTDGRKMSKSFGNCIFVNDTPTDVFGKAMSISDEVMYQWLPLFMDIFDPKEHPMKLKKKLAESVTNIIWPGKGTEELLTFEKNVQNKELPTDIPSIPNSNLIDFIVTLTKRSKGDCRRLIQQDAISVIRGEETIKANDMGFVLQPGDIVKAGKRNYAKVS